MRLRSAVPVALLSLLGLALPLARAQDALPEPPVLTEEPLASDARAAWPVGFSIVPQTDIYFGDDFQLGPTRHVLSLAPGEEKRLEIQLTNRERTESSYTLLTEDFTSGDARNPIALFSRALGPFSARSWVTLPSRSVRLKSAERAYLPVTVRVPANASAGDHYTAVVIQRDLPSEVPSGFNVVSRVASLLLITVEGDVVRDGSLQGLTSARGVYWSLPATFTAEYRNTGTVHLVPTGAVRIKNLFRAVVDEIPVRDWYVLRESSRLREIQWQPTFALGYYTATLSVTRGEGAPAEEQTVSFWVLPLLPVALVLLVIFLASFLVQVFFSRFEIRKKGQGPPAARRRKP